MPIPQNAQAIYTFLTGQGFNANAAAGILGNIEQESGGNPAAPGGGLIQILGHVGGTLANELQATMNYIRANGSVSDINAHASSPSAAALYFSTKYERPLASAANNPNREASAEAVAAAAKSGNWSTGSGASVTPSASTGGAGDILGWLTGSSGFLSDFADLFKIFHNLISPSFWLRIGAFFIGSALLVMGIYILIKANSDGSLMPKMPPIVPVPV
jgi:hypothetical protein